MLSASNIKSRKRVGPSTAVASRQSPAPAPDPGPPGRRIFAPPARPAPTPRADERFRLSHPDALRKPHLPLRQASGRAALGHRALLERGRQDSPPFFARRGSRPHPPPDRKLSPPAPIARGPGQTAPPSSAGHRSAGASFAAASTGITGPAQGPDLAWTSPPS